MPLYNINRNCFFFEISIQFQMCHKQYGMMSHNCCVGPPYCCKQSFRAATAKYVMAYHLPLYPAAPEVPVVLEDPVDRAFRLYRLTRLVPAFPVVQVVPVVRAQRMGLTNRGRHKSKNNAHVQ